MNAAVAPGVVQTDMSNFTNTDAGRDYTLGMQAIVKANKYRAFSVSKLAERGGNS
jgi:hypothetical protein